MLNTRTDLGSVTYKLWLTEGPGVPSQHLLTASGDLQMMRLGRRKESGFPLPMNKPFSLRWTRLILPWKILPSDLDAQRIPRRTNCRWESLLQPAASGPNVLMHKLCSFAEVCLHQLRQIPTFKSYETIKTSQMHSKSLSFLHWQVDNLVKTGIYFDLTISIDKDFWTSEPLVVTDLLFIWLRIPHNP